MPDIALRLRRTGLDACHLAQVDRLALADADHEVAHLVGVVQEFARLHGQHAAVGLRVDHAARGHAEVGGGQRLLQAQQVDAALAQAAGVDRHLHHAAGAADGLDLACAGHALELGLHRVRHALELDGAGCFRAPQRDREHRHVVDAGRPHDRRHHAQAGGQPVLVGIEHVVQAHQRLGARHADLKLHGHHGHAGARHRIGVLDAGDLRQGLLGRPRHQVLHVGAGRPREGDDHAGHRDVDLRLFLARRHQHRKQAQQQRHQRQQRRQRIRLEGGGQATGNAQCRGRAGRSRGTVHRRCGHLAGRASARPACTALAATFSPAFRPARISMPSAPRSAPRRTARNWKPWPCAT